MTILDGVATIFVTDLDRSAKFYTEIVGLTISRSIGKAWLELEAESGFKIGLHAVGPDSPGAGLRGSIGLGLECQGSMESILKSLQSHGVTIESEVKDGTAARTLFFADPDGNQLYLFQYQETAWVAG